MSTQNSAQMPEQKTGWKSAFQAFLDRRALIMLFLGFSSGLPIFLIFSTLSFWLNEAGVDRSTITMFAWAGLAYAFKFIWAPLIDKLPLPMLTKKMGQRRSWLLVAQILVVIAICLMAFTDPSMHGHGIGSLSSLHLMAIFAVFLGFSSATQDIIVDAYRIELSEDPNVQTVLASTYNAGYRIATIIAQLGALLFAAALGTDVGNYIYHSWQTTYLCLAGLMSIGVITTFVIHEPNVKSKNTDYKTTDYLQLVIVFVISTAVFVAGFIRIGEWIDLLNVKDAFFSFALQVLRFVSSVFLAVLVVWGLIKIGLIKQKIVVETWLVPLLDFFKRYGLKVALAVLLLIGFYRISDVVAGVVANLFYLDLNFDKEEIAWFNKFFAIFFVILGGFIGGLLSQRFNVMKMMLVGGIVASCTNLIFVGLVKSGASMTPVTVQIAGKNFETQPDEVGNWKLNVPSAAFKDQNQITITTRPQHYDHDLTLTAPIQSYNAASPDQITVQAIGGDNQLYQEELNKDVIIRGSLSTSEKEKFLQSVKIQLSQQTSIDAKLDQNNWSVVIPGRELAKANKFEVQASVKDQSGIENLSVQHSYYTFKTAQPKSRMSLGEVKAIQTDQNSDVELKGKVVVPYSKVWLVMGIIFDNLASGLAGAVFIAFLSSLTSVSFTAMQYAIFSSLMLLLPKMIGGYSGAIVTSFGYSTFFFMTFLMGIPILFLVVWVAKLLREHQNSSSN